jgi:hypothetical protein
MPYEMAAYETAYERCTPMGDTFMRWPVRSTPMRDTPMGWSMEDILIPKRYL